jgi:hypothetical protein
MHAPVWQAPFAALKEPSQVFTQWLVQCLAQMAESA